MIVFVRKQALLAFFFLFFVFSLPAHVPHAFLKENKYLVAKPVVNLHEKCSDTSPFVSQAIYGHPIYIVKEAEEGWALVETEEGYTGYAQIAGLIPDNPRWRTSRFLCRISSLAGRVYPRADIKNPALFRLPFDARIELIQDLDVNEDRWLKARLVDGKEGWIQRGDVEKLKIKGLEEMIALSHKFLELPYIWGGTSSEGFDCSGYIQTLFKQMGVLLPRDSRPQAAYDRLYPIDRPEKPGDLLFFGETKITHVGLYLGEGKFIHTGVRNHLPKTALSEMSKTAYTFREARRMKELTYEASISPLTEEILEKMIHSWREDNPVPLPDLCYLRMNYWGFDGCVHQGEMIVHKEVAQEVVDIFEELFLAKYPLEKMLLVDAYQASDELACGDNNTSAFCSKKAVGKSEWSYHSFGLAIDINPLLNPYHRGNTTVPAQGKEFLDRSLSCRGIITPEDLCYRAFISRGWKWGGHWDQERGYVDYQHFYKEL